MGCPPDVSRVTWRKPGGRGSFCRRASTGQSQVPLAHAPKSTPHHHIPSTLAGPMVRLGAHAPLWHSRPAPYEAGFTRLMHCLSVRCWQVISDPPRARTPPSFRRYAAPPPWSLCSAIAVVALHGRRCRHLTAAAVPVLPPNCRHHAPSPPSPLPPRSRCAEPPPSSSAP